MHVPYALAGTAQVVVLETASRRNGRVIRSAAGTVVAAVIARCRKTKDWGAGGGGGRSLGPKVVSGSEARCAGF